MSALKLTDVKAGQEIPALMKRVTMRQLVMWAGASGDYNPIHYDSKFAASRGLSNVVAHGQLITSFLCQMLSDWYGDAGCLKKLDVSYKGFNYPSDTLICRGLIKEVFPCECSVALEIWVENQRNEKTVSGRAVIQFAGA
ncbi:MAG: acyl dehydratase [Dehalococcoidia bacterium]|nr:acyl dehydratase [Dehalococcoidia bacterium]